MFLISQKDSLLSIINDTKQPDSSVVRAYAYLGYYFLFDKKNTASALYYVNKGIKKTSNKSNKK